MAAHPYPNFLGVPPPGVYVVRTCIQCGTNVYLGGTKNPVTVPRESFCLSTIFLNKGISTRICDLGFPEDDKLALCSDKYSLTLPLRRPINYHCNSFKHLKATDFQPWFRKMLHWFLCLWFVALNMIFFRLKFHLQQIFLEFHYILNS